MASPTGTKRQLTITTVMKQRNVRKRTETQLLLSPVLQQGGNSSVVKPAVVLISDDEDSDAVDAVDSDESEDWNSDEPIQVWNSDEPTEDLMSESSNDPQSLPVTAAVSDNGTNSSSSNCSAECCNGNTNDGPYQPKLNYTNVSKKVQGTKTRHFKPAWYSSFKWLSYCLTENKAFCFYCCLATTLNLVNFSKRKSDRFVSEGFENWKKAISKFRVHEASQMHRESCMKLNALKQKSVFGHFSDMKSNDQKHNREML